MPYFGAKKSPIYTSLKMTLLTLRSKCGCLYRDLMLLELVSLSNQQLRYGQESTTTRMHQPTFSGHFNKCSVSVTTTTTTTANTANTAICSLISDLIWFNVFLNYGPPFDYRSTLAPPSAPQFASS